MSQVEIRYIVTLVHGTFAHEPEKRGWTLSGSSTEENLRVALQRDGPAKVEFTEPFIWTGANNHRQRLKAGIDLATTLRDEERIPGDRRILVGHSHGGNVILYALRELSTLGIEKQIDGVVTLATPHLTASTRPLKDSFSVIGILGGGIVYAAICYFYVFALYDLLEKISESINLIIGGLLFTIGLFGIIGYIHGLIHENWHDHVVKLANVQANKIQAVTPPVTPLLCVTVTGDEALGALTIVERAAASPVIIWKFLAIAIGVTFYLGLIASVIFEDTKFGEMSDQIFDNSIGFGFLALIGALILIWVVSLLRRPAFGSESLILRTCLDIRVNAKPFGFETPRCEQKTFEIAELESELKGMKHSLPYQSQKIINYTAEWIIKANHPSGS